MTDEQPLMEHRSVRAADLQEKDLIEGVPVTDCQPVGDDKVWVSLDDGGTVIVHKDTIVRVVRVLVRDA